MDSYTMDAQAGPSRITLGPAISPSTKTAALPMVENDNGHHDFNHSTPRPFTSSLPVTPPRPARSSRRSLDSSIRRSSISSFQSGTVIHDWSPLRIQASNRRASSSHRSSFSSIHPTPGDDNRCRVSFDATPIPPSIADFPSITEEVNFPRVPSRGSFGQTEEPEEEDEEEEVVVTVKRKSTKKARFLEAPLMTRSDYDTSADSTQTRRSYLSAFTGEDDPELYADEFRVPVDETIRSVPGVIALGEGWAGGKRQKKKWFQRSPQVEEDPLSLWNQDNSRHQKPTSPSESPLKGIWSRSKRNLFGQSSPALLGEDPSSSDPPRSASRLGRLFSLSRTNLTSPENPSSSTLHRPSINPIKAKSKRFSLGIFSTSEISLQQNSSNRIPPSPSMPALSITGPPSPKHRTQRLNSRSAAARSEGDLSTIPEAPIPLRSSSLRKKQGLPPPWRPSSMIISGSNRNSMLLSPNLEHGGIAESTTSLETPVTCGSSTTSLSRGHALTRTATFGLEDIASEQRIDEENDPPEQEIDNDWIEVPRSESTNGNNGPTNCSLSRVPSPPRRRPSMKQRKNIWLQKMKNALTPSNAQEILPSSSTISQTVDRLLTRRKSSKTRSSSTESAPVSEVSSVPTSTSTSINSPAEPTMEPLRSSPPAPRRQANKHRRSASWMVRSSSSLAKRLSRLTEQEEMDAQNNDGIETEVVESRNRASSPFRFDEARNGRQNLGKSLHRKKSSNFSLLAMKSRRSSCAHSLDELEGLPASLSMPALSRLTTTDLNLHVDLEGEDLGLDDILDEERRGSIVHSIGRSTPNILLETREQALRTTFETLSGQNTPTTANSITRQPSPDPSYKAKMKAKHSSLPLNTSSYLDINKDSNPRKHKRTATVSTINSSPSPSLVTPRHPGELATFLTALTFPDTKEEEDAEMIIPSKDIDRSRRRNSSTLATSFQECGLTVPKTHRESVSTHRFSGESYLTQPSLYDTEEVVQGHAIRVESIEDMQRQSASVISLQELGRNWAGALQMTRA